jgi:hypothetical protein
MIPTKRKCAQPELSRTKSSSFGERNSRGSLRPKSFGVLGTDGLCPQINFYSWLLIGFEMQKDPPELEMRKSNRVGGSL